MNRWLTCLVLAIVLGVLGAVLPLPGILGMLLYAGAVIAAVLFLVFLLVDLTHGRRAP